MPVIFHMLSLLGCTYISSLSLYPYQRINTLLKTYLLHVVRAVCGASDVHGHVPAQQRVLLRRAECTKDASEARELYPPLSSCVPQQTETLSLKTPACRTEQCPFELIVKQQ